MAERLLSLMRADYENGTFRIEKWTNQTPSDIVPYLTEWLAEDGKSLSPATKKDYENSIKNHLAPWIFWWLKYHLRRPSEAMALHKIDYDKEQDAFLIRRTFSAKQLIEQTKT
ncbi:MAG: hypothetical protein ACXWMI_11695, partial [Syntrophales bacterium]